jgi:hypothetical protein
LCTTSTALSESEYECSAHHPNTMHHVINTVSLMFTCTTLSQQAHTPFYYGRGRWIDVGNAKGQFAEVRG